MARANVSDPADRIRPSPANAICGMAVGLMLLLKVKTIDPAETATRTDRSRAVPHPKTGSRR
jgi:hypothetical protein